jgi:hypothetical protein
MTKAERALLILIAKLVAQLIVWRSVPTSHAHEIWKAIREVEEQS